MNAPVGEPHVFVLTDADGTAVALSSVANEHDGLRVVPAVTAAASERALGARVSEASPAARLIPLLRVVTPDEGETLATLVTGWVRVEYADDAVEIEAIVVEALTIDRSGTLAAGDRMRCLPEDWWGDQRSTSRHWPSAQLSADELVSAIAKIHAELTRNAAVRLGEVRRELERLVARALHPIDDGSHALDVDVDDVLTALIDVARVASGVSSRLGTAEREIAFLWRGGGASDEISRRVAAVHAGRRPEADLDERVDRSYLLMARQCAAARALLADEMQASYDLLSGVGALSASRDAAGQAQLNRIAASTAVLATVLGTVLALYGADLVVPGMDQRPGALLAGLAVVVSVIFLLLFVASDTPHDQNWWRGAAGLSVGMAVLFAALAVASAREQDTTTVEFECARTAASLDCSGDMPDLSPSTPVVSPTPSPTTP